jgi:hypothetical protein
VLDAVIGRAVEIDGDRRLDAVIGIEAALMDHVRRAVHHIGVVAAAAVERVGASAAVERVMAAGAAAQRVVAGQPGEEVESAEPMRVSLDSCR